MEADRTMATDVMVADWIKRIADDERTRDAVRSVGEQTAARKAELIRVHGLRMLADLRAAATRDVDAFRGEFAGDPARDITFDSDPPQGGFVVRKPGTPAVTLALTPRMDAAAVSCHYRFTPAAGLPTREDRFDLMFSDDGDATLRMKHHGTGQVFATVDALSEFLLVPVLTGRPR
jgi:hypothetical protein